MSHREESWSLLSLPVVPDHRGNLTFIEGQRHVPFDIARVYYLYGVPGGASRAGHAHKQLAQLLIAAAGSFDVHLDDGKRKQTISLNSSNQGLLVRSLVWRELHNFSEGAVCLVLASMPYEESDYYRDYDEFLAALRRKEP